MTARPEIITVTLNPCIDKTVQVCAFSTGATNRILSSREEIGGKGINVSRALCGSGIPTLTACVLAQDRALQLRSEFRDRQMPLLLQESNGSTRVNLKIIDTTTGEMTELNEAGQPIADAADQLWTQIEPFLPTAKLLVLSGSLPPQTEPRIYAQWMRKSAEYGVVTILDAAGDALQYGTAAKPHAVKPNIEEFRALVDAPLSGIPQIGSHMRRLNAEGIDTVVVSLGADGALFAKNGTLLHAKPFPITVGSAAAAGDAMVAMLAVAHLRGLSLQETAKLACAAGTLTAEKQGTQTASFGEAAAAADQIRIEDYSAL